MRLLISLYEGKSGSFIQNPVHFWSSPQMSREGAAGNSNPVPLDTRTSAAVQPSAICLPMARRGCRFIKGEFGTSPFHGQRVIGTGRLNLENSNKKLCKNTGSSWPRGGAGRGGRNRTKFPSIKRRVPSNFCECVGAREQIHS